MTRNRPIRIVMMSSHHHPLDGRVYYLEARTLRDAGYKVTIVSPAYDDLPERYEQDGIEIFTFRKRGWGPFWKLNTLYQLYRLALSIPADVLHVHEIDAPLWAAAAVKRKLRRSDRKIKILVDAHEVWTHFFAAKSLSSIRQRLAIHAILEMENRLLHNSVDAVITAHELERFYYRWQNPWIPVRHVLSAPDFDTPPPDRSGPIRTIGHEGYFTLNRGMDIILKAFEKLAPRYPDITLLTAGDFLNKKDREWYHQWAERTGLGDRVTLSGWVNRADLPDLLDRMDVGVAAIRDDPHSIRIWPANKLMNYFSRAVPTVLCPNLPYLRQYVEEPGYGRVSDFDVDSLVENLTWMIDNPDEARLMSRRAYEYAQREWNWDRYRGELLRVYQDLDQPTLRRTKHMTLQG